MNIESNSFMPRHHLRQGLAILALAGPVLHAQDTRAWPPPSPAQPAAPAQTPGLSAREQWLQVTRTAHRARRETLRALRYELLVAVNGARSAEAVEDGMLTLYSRLQASSHARAQVYASLASSMVALLRLQHAPATYPPILPVAELGEEAVALTDALDHLQALNTSIRTFLSELEQLGAPLTDPEAPAMRQARQLLDQAELLSPR